MLSTIKIREQKLHLRNTLKLLLLFTVFASVIMTGCDLSYLGFGDSTKGALKITVNSSRFSSSRSVLPETDMTPTEYRITGEGPSGAVFEKTVTGGYCSVFDLAIGNWTISVIACNEAGTQIGWGESTVTVNPSAVTDISVLVEPYTGKGAVSFSITWNEEDVADPAITAILTDTSGTETELPFSVDSGSATYSNSDVSAGYYTLNIKLLDGDYAVSGLVESVRILQDFQTTGSFDFSDLNQPSGDISISVIVDMFDPFEPVISGATETLAYGSDMTVSASVPDSDGETLIYRWYVNGELVGSEEIISFGSALRRGTYRLDLVVTNEDGTRSGSATHDFIIE